MFIYLAVFALSSFFTAIAQYSSQKKQSGAFLAFSSIAILLPVLLAAFRDPGIGTDTASYGINVWHSVLTNHRLDSLLHQYNNGYFPEVELIYLALNWFIAQFTDDIHVLFFALNLIVIGFIYKAAYDNRHKANMWQVMLFFNLLFYSNSLNLLRQYIAVAIGTYAYKFLETREWKKLIFWVIIMFLWHNTTIVFVALIGIDILFKIKNKKINRIIYASIALSIYILFVHFDEILLFIVNRGLIPYRFKAYLSQYSDETFFDTTSTLLAFFMLAFFVYLRFYLKPNENKNELTTFFSYKAIATALNLTSMISKFVFRMSYFFSNITDCIFLPRALFMLKEKSRSRYYIFSTLFVLLCTVFWYFLYVKNGINQVIPYKSSILGIN